MECNYCGRRCWRSGRQKNGAQRYYCSGCKKYQQTTYRYRACLASTSDQIKAMICESMGARGIARVLGISRQTALNRIMLLGKGIKEPEHTFDKVSLEADELWTYVGRKDNEYWVVYAIDRNTRSVVDFVVGKRTKVTLKKLIDRLLALNPKVIRTDKLTLYKQLIPEKLHRCGANCINRIERKNLTIRTHLKRLSRRTICFSRSLQMLESCLRIYFWGNYPIQTLVKPADRTEPALRIEKSNSQRPLQITRGSSWKA
jgi:insertion element IS1 protein InsB